MILTFGKKVMKSPRAAKKTNPYKPAFFSGQTPPMQAPISIRFLSAHAMLNAAKKTLVLFAQIFGNRKKIDIHTPTYKFISPGFPKLVPSALNPDTTISFPGIYAQGNRQQPIMSNIDKIPMGCVYFIIKNDPSFGRG